MDPGAPLPYLACVLDFTDLPYQWFEPRPNRLARWLLRCHNRRTHLPGTLQITRVQIQGHGGLGDYRRAGDRLVLLPNHPTHADAAILLEATRQAGLSTQVMAAYDVFLRSRRDAWVMQRLGAFSVDRDSSDPRAMKTALSVIERGRHALTVFPEGNVYLENDRVTPFNDGAAFLALRGAKAAAAQNQRVWIVPVSIKATHREDVRSQITARLTELARALDTSIDENMTPVEVLRKLGGAALRRNLKHRGLDIPETDKLGDFIEHAGGAVLQGLETKLGITAKPGDELMDRIRKARRIIHEVRTDPERVADHAAASTWADEAMFALRIASYSGRYAADHPSVDRIAETAEKLAEDVHRKMMPPTGTRSVTVRFGKPLDLTVYLDNGKPRRGAVSEVSAAAEAAVQDGLDQINAANTLAGAALWDSPIGEIIPAPGV